MSADETVPPDAGTPTFRITHGHPDDVEIAAVMAVLQAATAARPPADEGLGDRPRAGGWKSYWRVVRRPLVPGRDAWTHTL
ncbi:MAG TPA: acyl-CoA carboxylase subunit epsilon [Propionibacteriaceae bacterium]|nr:acyl-CoA carboxylase subunit epsilon [Propionibacteriaceae bacterium]